MKDYLRRYLKLSPVSLALPKALECHLLSDVRFAHPLLDLGCGDGLFASIFFTNEKIDVGLDLSGDELILAESTGRYERLVQADMAAIPLPDEYFSSVLCNCALQRVDNVDDVLKEVARVLRPDGTFCFTVINEDFEKHHFFPFVFRKLKLVRFAEAYRRFYNRVFCHHHCFGRDSWQERLEKAGLDMTHCENYTSRRMVMIEDFFLSFCIFPFYIKKILKRWVLMPWFRTFFLLPLLEPFLNRILSRELEKKDEDGARFLIIARKR
jgi:ubiquinone/menaquinone biosynthesis C-methylase UbiE